MDGLVAKIKVANITEFSVLAKEVNMLFDLEKLKEYKRIFKKLGNDGIIIKGKYDEDQWVVKRNTIRSKNAYFNFDKIHDLLQKEILRAFVTIKLTTTEATFVLRSFNKITYFLAKYNLDNSKVIAERFKAYLYFESNKRPRPLNGIRSIILAWEAFLTFSKWNNELKEIFRIVNHAKNNIDFSSDMRTLPRYSDVLIFNDALTNFMKRCEKEAEEGSPNKLVTYYPLFLWWKISNIIPMRPTEFLLLKRDCIIQEGEVYLLEVERIKDNEAILNNIPIETKIPISEELKIDIDRYIELSSPYHFSSINQLCSFTTYLRMLKAEDIFSRIYIDFNKASTMFFNEFHLLRLLNLFYEIIYEDYSDLLIKEFNDKGRLVPRPLEMLRLGDTRHFAIYQLRMRGLSALTIARLAGHKQIKTQEKYMRHGKWFAESEIALLEEKMLRTRAFMNESGYSDLEKWIEVIDDYNDKSGQNNSFNVDFSELPVVDQQGTLLIRCLHEPTKCKFEGECSDCSNSLISPEECNNDVNHFLIQRSSYLHERMIETIDVMNEFARKMSFDFEKNIELDNWETARINQMTKEIRELQFQQASINAKIKKYERMNRGVQF